MTRLGDAYRRAGADLVMALGLVENDNRTIGWGVGLTVAGCVFATVVLATLCWFGMKALSWLV